MGTYRGYYYHHHCCFSCYLSSFSRWFIGVVWSLGVVSGGGLLVIIDDMMSGWCWLLSISICIFVQLEYGLWVIGCDVT